MNDKPVMVMILQYASCLHMGLPTRWPWWARYRRRDSRLYAMAKEKSVRTSTERITASDREHMESVKNMHSGNDGCHACNYRRISLSVLFTFAFSHHGHVSSI